MRGPLGAPGCQALLQPKPNTAQPRPQRAEATPQVLTVPCPQGSCPSAQVHRALWGSHQCWGRCPATPIHGQTAHCCLAAWGGSSGHLPCCPWAPNQFPPPEPAQGQAQGEASTRRGSLEGSDPCQALPAVCSTVREGSPHHPPAPGGHPPTMAKGSLTSHGWRGPDASEVLVPPPQGHLVLRAQRDSGSLGTDQPAVASGTLRRLEPARPCPVMGATPPSPPGPQGCTPSSHSGTRTTHAAVSDASQLGWIPGREALGHHQDSPQVPSGQAAGWAG